jgi:hypothetical protein
MVFFLNVWEMHWVSTQCFFSKANINNINKKNWKKIKWSYDNLIPQCGKICIKCLPNVFFLHAKQIENNSNNYIMVFLLDVGRNAIFNCLIFFLRPHQKKNQLKNKIEKCLG